jgi:REP element-mobilizing transposase RayT
MTSDEEDVQMSELYQSLSHSKWDCKYHVVFVPKRRRKAIFGQTRRHLGQIFHALARQKECQILEGHLMPDHVHMCIAIPPKHPVSSVIGFLKGKSAIAIAGWAARNEISRASISGPGATPFLPSGLNWNRSANTSASRRARMEQTDSSELSTKARFNATPRPIADRL